MKTREENYIFWSEIESGFEEPSGTLPGRIRRRTSPGVFRGCFVGAFTFKLAFVRYWNMFCSFMLGFPFFDS